MEEFDLRGSVILAVFRAYCMASYGNCRLFYKIMREALYKRSLNYQTEICEEDFLFFMLG